MLTSPEGKPPFSHGFPVVFPTNLPGGRFGARSQPRRHDGARPGGKPFLLNYPVVNGGSDKGSVSGVSMLSMNIYDIYIYIYIMYIHIHIYIYILPIQWGAVQSYLEFPNHLIVNEFALGQS